MKWNITFVITGPSGRVLEAPCSSNPVEADSIEALMQSLVESKPLEGIATIVGIRIDRADIDPESIEVG